MTENQPVVVIIDDDDAIREYARFILEKEGMRVFEAGDGNRGLAVATAHPPSLIVTDLVMPDKEGIETIREIKTRFPDCGIIAMSGAAKSDTYLSMAHCLGAHCIVRKPFDREQFIRAVRETLAMRNRAAGTFQKD
jgi:DNA-binding NtrC family response regulator